MGKQEKIDTIYKEIANKELSFGCYIEDECSETFWRQVLSHIEIDTPDWNYYKEECWWASYNVIEDLRHIYGIDKTRFLKEYKVIWHPVMIGDVLDYMFRCEDWTRNEWIIDEVIEKLIMPQSKYQWWNKRKPIEEQSEQCIDYVYDLIK